MSLSVMATERHGQQPRTSQGCAVIADDLAAIGLGAFQALDEAAWRRYPAREWATIFGSLSSKGRVDLLDEPTPRVIFFRGNRPWLILLVATYAGRTQVLAGYADPVDRQGVRSARA